MPAHVNGFSLGYTAFGAVVLWSGIRGGSISETFHSLLQGQAPPVSVDQTTQTEQAIGNASGLSKKQVSGTNTSIKNLGLTAMVASTFGWAPPGRQFAALTQIISEESGGDPTALNGSGAFGIAQALGHGTANTAGTKVIKGTTHNEYGGFGVPDSTCRAANNGDARAQLIWMCSYIKDKFGTPEAAQQYHLANNSY